MRNTITVDKSAFSQHMTYKKVRYFLGNYGLLVFFIMFFIFMSITSEAFLSVNNLMNIVLQTSIVGLIAIGMTFVIVTGGIDLSVGSVAGFAGAIAAFNAKSALNGWEIPLLVGLAAGLLMGAINSFVIIQGRVLPFLATLAMMTVVRGVALIFTKGYPVVGLSDIFLVIGQGKIWAIPIPIIIFAFVAALMDFLLSKTQFGRHVYAVGGNPEASAIAGINVKTIRLKVYLLSGFLAALSGVILTSRVNAADPLAGVGFDMDAVAASVIGGTSLAGGKGTIRGTILGILLLGMVMNGLDLLNVSSYYHQIIKGVILIAAVLLDRWKST